MIQPDLLSVEDTSDVAPDFSEFLRVFFYLCQSTLTLKLISSFMVHRRLPPQPESFKCMRFCPSRLKVSILFFRFNRPGLMGCGPWGVWRMQPAHSRAHPHSMGIDHHQSQLSIRYVPWRYSREFAVSIRST